VKSRSQEFCVVNESSGKVMHCPCVGKRQQQCLKRCRCLNGKNKPPCSEAQHACRCGEEAKTTEGVMRESCIDIHDGSGIPCSEKCRCKGCENSFGKKQVSAQSDARKRISNKKSINSLPLNKPNRQKLITALV